MKKQFMLIFLLTYALVSCPALTAPAFAGRERTSPSVNGPLIRTTLQVLGRGDSLPDTNIDFPTTWTGLIDAFTNLDFIQTMTEARDQMLENRADRIQDLKDRWPFGGRSTGE